MNYSRLIITLCVYIVIMGLILDCISGISRLNITSGSRTYRIPSPTRPLISRNVFQPSPPLPNIPSSTINAETNTSSAPQTTATTAEISSLDSDPTNQKGFYISFDNDQPKRPKPPLRTKRGSPKKEQNNYGDRTTEENILEMERLEKKRQLERELDEERIRKENEDRQAQKYYEQERLRMKREASQERQKVAAASSIIIGNDLSNPDPDLVDELERKKERIMMLSLQRRQQQEEAKSRKEQEAQARREREKQKKKNELGRKKNKQLNGLLF